MKLISPIAADYKRVDKVIRKGTKTFQEVGRAMVEMHDGKLYKHKFDTFEDYAESCGFSRRNAYKIIKAIHTMIELENVPESSQISREALTKLADIPADKKTEVLEKSLQRGNGNPTGRDIIEVYAEVQKDKTDVADETLDNRISTVLKSSGISPSLVIPDKLTGTESKDLNQANVDGGAIQQKAPENESSEKPCENATSLASGANPPPDSALTEAAKENAVLFQKIQDLEADAAFMNELLKGIQEGLGCQMEDYSDIVEAIEALKEKTPDSALDDIGTALGVKPQPEVILKAIASLLAGKSEITPLTPKLYERKLAALDLGAEQVANGDELERKKYGVIANRSVVAFMNPKKKAEYNPYA
jgi:hypothetical protein